MGEHRFSDAVTYAEKALSLGSGDLSSFAIVGDANADMGEYERAAIAYSRLDVSGECCFAAAERVCARQPHLVSQICFRRHCGGDPPDAKRGCGWDRSPVTRGESCLALLRTGRV